ncbi:MAG: NAD(P)/FAD-dependent oxidoreductase [Pyrinomonadaceae bacterium]
MVSTIAIVGGGPAGSSLAIRLAQAGFGVTLIERETFPRQKLCGEFISPECIAHFDELGVADRMFARGGDRIAETVFYERGGRSLVIPSEWFGAYAALSLSRAEMDLILLERARDVGVKILESTRLADLVWEGKNVTGLNTRGDNGSSTLINADLFIDASGRSAVVRRMLDKKNGNTPAKRPSLLGFKVHMKDIDLEPGRCEIYSFEGGYGGLSYVEDGTANFCFLIKASTARKCGGKAEPIVERAILKNKRAAVTLKNAKPIYDWLAVAVDRFGKKELAPARNVFAVGDAAAFIDPFTGSGMLLAFESSEVLAGCITQNRERPENLPATYNNWFNQKFLTRLRISSLVRNAVYVPHAAAIAIKILGSSRAARKLLTRTTRHGLSISANRR